MAISEKYKSYWWKFAVFGAVTGLLMGISDSSAQPGMWISDLMGGALLWVLIGWAWAWSKSRSPQ